jgi:hypothetical protein
MADAIVAPRASPFINANNRLTPAWHNYLSNIERLTKGIVATNVGSSLAAIAERITALEEQVTAAEEAFTASKNWAFRSFTKQDGITELNDGHTLQIEHGMNTMHLIARGFNNDFSGGNASSHDVRINNANNIQINSGGGTYGGNGDPRIWILAFYGFDDA